MNALSPQAIISEPWRYLGSPDQRAALFRTELLSAALDYAERGYPVFPVGQDKRPLVKWKAGATTDLDQVRSWWARWPLAMIGMPTGKPSGVVVIDIDRKNGVDGLANLKALGIDPRSLSPVISITPSGGLHVFVRYDGPIKNSAGLLTAGVDIRGDGGFIVLPPSLPDINGDEYQWEGGDYGCL